MPGLARKKLKAKKENANHASVTSKIRSKLDSVRPPVKSVKKKRKVSAYQKNLTKGVSKRSHTVKPSKLVTTPEHLKSKAGRVAYVRDMVHAPLTNEDRKTEAKEVQKEIRKEWFWDEKRDNAAFLLAEDRMTDQKICSKLNISPNQLLNWKKRSPFVERIAQYVEEWQKHVMSTGGASKANRIRALNEVFSGLQEIVDARRRKYADKQTPGIATGLMIREVKAVGHGPKAKVVRQWKLDKELVSELRDVGTYLARESGQWKDVVENKNEVVLREYSGVSPEDV